MSKYVQFQVKTGGQVFTGRAVGSPTADGQFVDNVRNSNGGQQFFPPFFQDCTFVTNNQFVGA